MECWALGLMTIRQARREPLALSPSGRESEWSTVVRRRVGRNGLIFPHESPDSVT